MQLRREIVARLGSVLAVAILLSAASLFFSTVDNKVAAGTSRDHDELPVAPSATFNASAGSLGAIPDHVGTCQTAPFNSGRTVFFTASGLGPTITNVQLSMTFGAPIHPFVGDISATLIAPNGDSHVVFARTLATTAAGFGDSSDLAGPYVFRDAAVPPNGGWWQTAAIVGAGAAMTPGEYRTTNSGGAGAPNPQPATNMTASFAGVPNPNGSWALRLVDGCSGDTGAISAASLTIDTVGTFKSRADFDGDGRTDISVFRPAGGSWYLNRSTNGFLVQNWGIATDIPAPGDFDGDGRADMTIFRPSTGTWWILRSTGGFGSTQFGSFGDIPVVGDYNGDGLSDIAVFRPTTNVWYIQLTGGGTIISLFGAAGDLPVRADYDGDGSTDIAVFRPLTGQWWIANSGGGTSVMGFGVSTDRPVPADYDGDDRDDIAIYRPSNGQWWVSSSINGSVTSVPFGNSTDIPVPGDYDGDGTDDRAIYRSGVWWVRRANGGITVQSFGVVTDTPIPAQYIP